MDEAYRGNRAAVFGRRHGHKLSRHRAGLLQSLLPSLALDLSLPADDLTRLFSPKVEAVRLEIGFGGGEHLIAQAERAPQLGFIGAEPFVNGIAKALAAIKAKRLANIRLYQGDARDVIAWLPSGSLVRVDLIYPDPWPKRRHWKRRLVQDTSLAEIARILGPHGEFRFVTDAADYAAWTLARTLRTRDLVWTAEKADDWRHPWEGFTPTRYAAKAKGAGRLPCYLIFRKESGRAP